MRLKRIISTGLAIVLSVTVISFVPESIAVYAATPPSIGAQGAAVYNANTGEFLYEKNGDTQFAPASITKIMTGLLTVEQANLDDTVYFNSSAVANLESGATVLPVRAGDTMSVRDALYAMMLASANEV
ncbi:MAG: D-alanyl-D-alanine carboxypeptidase, partial [Lachnospiraceae bacterium oral taxon 082]|nr:D-alanyl-D-alanine carboxypeptidase [Lachnospiraceae bacterium oral taxon 082]